MGGRKFRRTVTRQINMIESAEGKRLLGGPGHAPEKICKITPKVHVFVHSESKF